MGENRLFYIGLAMLFTVGLLFAALGYMLGIRVSLIVGTVIVISALVILIFFKDRKTMVSTDKDKITVKGVAVKMIIPYKDISSVEMRDDIKYGHMMAGYGALHYYGGKYKNEEFGVYKIAVDDRIRFAVVITHAGKKFVFNADSEERTKELYDEIAEKID